MPAKFHRRRVQGSPSRRADEQHRDPEPLNAASSPSPDGALEVAIARLTHQSWFDPPVGDHPGISRAPSRPTFADLFTDPKIVVQALGELDPAVAGAVAGALGAALATCAFAIGAWLHPGHLVARWLDLGVGAPLGVALVVAVGGAIGLGFAVLARRLRRLVPLVVFAIVASLGVALALQGAWFLRLAPNVAGLMPAGPTLLAAAVFGASLALELPLRRLGARARGKPR